ncbi:MULTISPECIES: alpha/beta fold hydrolase [unclassified Oleiphilus]|uniref:alpha/beta hydrolase family protein n=3 Tax=Oleiphilus TaxID=141450 RepID=UPI0007C29980|nr:MULTISPECIES: alpha/beta fold hydrolase [unclassified Oleiphilus]KZY66748.1 hypothetical protein A3738_00485 [Oleiphilus sp. HI0066]KZY76703.1 hypothetical protein A3739_13910 [Oleiphilus sp. HI0067]
MKLTTTLTCRDHTSLLISEFSPENPPLGTIVIASAFGVNQSFYWPMAEFFVKQGYKVLCFDYRGTGDNESLTREDFELSEWGTQDIEGVLRYAISKTDQVYFIGHSIGGQLLALAPSSEQLKSAVFVAASAPYWKRWPRLADGLKIRVNIGFILPIVSRIYSPFPADKFGLGNQNLPSKAVQQWAKWMSKPNYLLDPSFGLDCSRFYSMQIPILSYAFSDDALAPKENINHLLRQFHEADCELKLVKPKDVDAKHIGHTGMFKAKFESTLWKETFEFLTAHN